MKCWERDYGSIRSIRGAMKQCRMLNSEGDKSSKIRDNNAKHTSLVRRNVYSATAAANIQHCHLCPPYYHSNYSIRLHPPYSTVHTHCSNPTLSPSPAQKGLSSGGISFVKKRSSTGIFFIISSRTLGTSAKNQRAAKPATPPKPPARTPLCRLLGSEAQCGV